MKRITISVLIPAPWPSSEQGSSSRYTSKAAAPLLMTESTNPSNSNST